MTKSRHNKKNIDLENTTYVFEAVVPHTWISNLNGLVVNHCWLANLTDLNAKLKQSSEQNQRHDVDTVVVSKCVKCKY